MSTTTRLHRAPTFLIPLALLAPCSPVNAQETPPPPHHRPNGYQNNYIEFKPPSLLDVLKWKRDASRDDLPKPPRTPTPAVQPDTAFIQANARAGAMAMQPAIT